MKRKILALTMMFCMIFSIISYAAPSEKTLQGSAYKHLLGFMNRFEKSKFSSVVKIGTLSTYRAELSDVKIVIKSSMKASAMYDPVSNTMYLSKDPAKVSANQSLSMGETIWHELTHKIEDAHNDIGTFDSKEYAERNIEYMTYVVGVALPVLQQMENDKNADSAKIQKYWDIFVKRLEAANKLPEIAKYPADLKLMEEWFGFKVNPAALTSFYQKGGAGGKIATALTPGVAYTWGGVWKTNYDVMTLTQTGNVVTGPYAHHGGRIEATANGKTLSGRWIESDNEGTFTMTMSEDGKSFTGTWVQTKPSPAGGGGWNGSRSN